MRDYYYTLGVGRNAALSDIQQAYRKLSLKFHPEKNGDDPFFALHYDKIKEAYQVLSDDHKRFRYDKAYEKQLSAEVEDILEVPTPVIAAFFASKNTAQKGDIITISWEVFNAETVRINLIGEVSTNGTQTIRLAVPSEKEPYLYLDLEASNSGSIKSSSKRIALKNTAYKAGASSDLPPAASLEHVDWEAATVLEQPAEEEADKAPSKATKKPKKRTPKKAVAKTSANQQKNAWAAYLLVAVLFFMIIVMLYTILLINPIF